MVQRAHLDGNGSGHILYQGGHLSEVADRSSDTMSTPKKGPSVTKTLISLIQSDPSNRSCADCRSALVDPSYVYASLCPSLEEIQKRGDQQSRALVTFHDFKLTHRAFAPPDIRQSHNLKFGLDPAMTINQRFGGHGLFVCTKCAEAHKTLRDDVTKVIAVQDSTAWTKKEAHFMKMNGGNAKSRTVYEAYMPETWKGKRPTPTSSLEDRIIFCKAKYEALAFVMPPPGPLSNSAWTSILQRNETGKRFHSTGLEDIHSLTPAFSSQKEFGRSVSGGALPNRLIDFFCVVSSSRQLHPHEVDKDLFTLSSPEELHLWPQIADCYPHQEMYNDMLFPAHLPSFVLPRGCCPSKTQQAPSFYTFVLTLGDGDRVYGGALQIYDELIEVEDLKGIILSSGYEGALPRFLDVESDVLFLPKCLILLSHYPFFDMFRESLLQLYRITLVEAPLPIERYIVNLVSEVPLPPQGKIRVEFGFTSRSLISIERPPPNKLPLANFSYRPLFASLSVGNIIVVLGCMLEECKVALLSSHCSILTPVAEALLSALFPFEWQGLYIPVMPYSMRDILDAPVPFIVGLDSRYLHETPSYRRPMNVVFVDLDRDVIHLGVDELTEENRKVPPLPPKSALKLKISLDEAGGSMYLLPNSGIKGCIMEGHEELLLVPNDDRPKYAVMQSVTLDVDSLRRDDVLGKTKKAYDENELSEGISGFRTLHGLMKEQDGHDSDSSGHGNGGKRTRRRRRPKFMRNIRSEILASSMEAGGQAHLLDMNDPGGFSFTNIRNAFLRFMVATFSNYGKFVLEGDAYEMFDDYKFLRDLGEEKEPTAFVGRILKTQMFQRFLEERMDNPDQPEIRFFDESIVAKLNRSRVKKMAKGGKLPTPFLDNESDKITKTYTPPPPSNMGLPDSNEGYHYNQFPPLEASLMGRVRPPLMWDIKQNQLKRMRSTRNLNVHKTQQDIVRRAMAPLVAPAILASLARKSAKDLESALSALRGIQWDKHLKHIRSPKKEIARTLLRTSTTESTESERTVTTLSKADTIMMNARRKQSILLDLIIMLQSQLRLYITRKRYTSFRAAIVRMQRRFRQIPDDAVWTDDKPNPRVQLMYIVAIQREMRRFLARKAVDRRRKALTTIQSRVACYAARRRFAQQRASALLIQKHVKGRRDRFWYKVMKLLVSRLQARIRGYQVRKRVQIVLEQEMKLFRQEIFSLWQECHVQLSLRTKFWPLLMSGASFARIRTSETELRRLWHLLGIEVDGKGLSCYDETTAFAGAIGINVTTYCICQELSLFTKHDTPFETLRPALAMAYGFVEAERLQIYERLNSKAFEKDTDGIYRDFGIPSTEKKKKVAVARVIWSSFSVAGLSLSTMLKLFPELSGSLNVSFQPACSKSKRRFPEAQKPPSTPVTIDLWDRISLDGLIRKHTKEVTHLYITQVPTIMARLDDMNERKGTRLSSRPFALDEKEREQLKKYLHRPVRDSDVEHVLSEATPIEQKRASPEFAEVAEFPDMVWNAESDDNILNSSQFPNIMLDTEPLSSPNFPEISFEMSKEDDPAIDANFPDIGLEEPFEKDDGMVCV